MRPFDVKKVVILGGGTAGWMTAAALATRYRSRGLVIELIESDAIGTVGVGEATVPGIRDFHFRLGIAERDFIRATQASFKLGIEFKDWCTPGRRFFHAFSDYGMPISGWDFYQCWLKLQEAGYKYDLEDFSLAIGMARRARFAQPDEAAESPLACYGYAYHFDASAYAGFLKKHALAQGVVRTEALVEGAITSRDTGAIEKLQLEDGRQIVGDLFIDCSGFRARLIEQEMRTGFEDWSQWLPCDSALAVQSAAVTTPIKPYTESTAREAGWQWRIPLQSRVGNGYVYASRHLSDDAARYQLLEAVQGPLLTEPKVIRFTAGMRHRFWNKNCVALGLASGFLEPLESTSISLIQTGVDKLVQAMPDLRVTADAVARANELNRNEYQRLRDFIILHYHASQRRDSEFWRQVTTMSIPDTLQAKIEAFMEDGSVMLAEQESFRKPSWIAMYNGFGRIPRHSKEILREVDPKPLAAVFDSMKTAIAKGAAIAPSHDEFLATV